MATVSLQDRNISRVDVAALQLRPDTQKLDLSRNRIVKIEALDALENLQVLNLSFNRLVKVEGLGRLRLLQVVNVSNNSLRDIGCLAQCLALQELARDFFFMYAGVNSLDNTRGLSGDGNLPALAQLRILSLPDNQIRRVNNLSGCTALQVLDLSQNYIDDVRSLAEALPPSLRALNISNNRAASISDVRHMAALSRVMHIFVTGCPFALAAADAHVDLAPLFASLLPELVTVDSCDVSPSQRAQGNVIAHSLQLHDSVSNEHVIRFMSALASSSRPPPSTATSVAAAAPALSSRVVGKRQDAGPTAATAAHPHSLAAAAAPALAASLPLPSAKSVHVLAHDITRLRHKLASFAPPAPPPHNIHATSLPPPRPVQLLAEQSAPLAAAPHSSFQHAAPAPVSSGLHHSASVISRAWRSFRSRRLSHSACAQAADVQRSASVAAAEDSSVIKRLEILEKTVAIQLQVIEKLHAAIQRSSAASSSLPVWRIVADATAAATRIQSTWRGHIDREVAQIIRQRKRNRALAADAPDAKGRNAERAAAAITISAFVRRKRAEESAKWMLFTISSQCLFRLVCNMGERLQSLEQRLLQLEGSSQQPSATCSP